MKNLKWLVGFMLMLPACGTTRGTAPTLAPSTSASSERSSAPVANSSPPDPFAPVLAPGPDRPRTMRSTLLAGLGRVTSVAAFRPPSREHTQGTILLGVPPAAVVEVDIAKGSAVATHPLAAPGASVRVAATDAGVVAVVDESDADPDTDVAFVFDASFALQNTVKLRGWASNVSADGTLAVVGSALRGKRAGELTVLALPSGAVAGKREVLGTFADEWVTSSQVLVHGDRVYALTRGDEHYVLKSFSADLARPLAEAKLLGSKRLTTPPCGVPGPHYGDGVLAPVSDGLLVVREDSIEAYDWDLASELPIKSGMSRFPEAPAVDETSKRVLFPSGEAAKSLGDERTNSVVVFRHDVWKWSSDGEVPLRYGEPVRALFVAGRGVIVTEHPEVRITVLDWEAA